MMHDITFVAYHKHPTLYWIRDTGAFFDLASTKFYELSITFMFFATHPVVFLIL